MLLKEPESRISFNFLKLSLMFYFDMWTFVDVARRREVTGQEIKHFTYEMFLGLGLQNKKQTEVEY